MKQVTLSLIFSVSVHLLMGQSIPPIQWQKLLGGSLSESDGNENTRIIKTSDKGYLVAGSSYSSDGHVSGNNGAQDAWIVKLNEKGTLQWERHFGGNDRDWLNSIQQTSDGGYIVCGVVSSTNIPFNQRPGAFDVWVMKLSSQGEIQWQRFFGGTSWDYGQSILQTADGGYIFCGRTQSVNGDVTLNHGKSDIWVVRLNPSGNVIWQKTYGGVNTEFGNRIIHTADGGYVIAGWQSQTASDLITSADMQSYVIKIDGQGNKQWEKKYGGSKYEDINSIKQTADGGYVFVGTTRSNDGDVSGNHFDTGVGEYHDIWVVKLNNSGNLLWQKCVGGSIWDEGYDIVEATDGYYLAGQTQSNNGDMSGNHGLIDALIAKISLQGELQIVKLFGGSQSESFNSILLEQNEGNIDFVLAGITGSNDKDVNGNNGSADIWVAKLSTQSFRYNTLSGGAYLDINANGHHDAGEPGYDNKHIYITDNNGFFSKYKYTAPGLYSIRVDTGKYELSLNLPDTSGFRSVPRKRSVTFTTYGNTDFFEFALIDKGHITSATISIEPDSAARPTRTVSYTGYFAYSGSREQIDGIIKIARDRRLTYLSSSLTPISVAGDTLLFRFNNLPANFQESFSISFKLADAPTSRSGDTLVLKYNMMPLTVDSSYFDEWHSTKQVISERLNIIKGNVFVDSNNNGVWDFNELPFSYGLVLSEKGNSSVSTSLSGDGYLNAVDTGMYQTKLILNNSYYHVNPPFYNSNFSTYFNVDSFDFALVPIAGIRDLQINIIPLSPVKPGFKSYHVMPVLNAGTDSIFTVNVQYIKDPRTSYVTAYPVPLSIHGDTLNWMLDTLAPLEERGIVVEIKASVPPIVNQDDILNFKATVSPVMGDTTPSNNMFELEQKAVNSFDPNDKAESHAGEASVAKLRLGEYLNYVIRFQNTGNYEATNIIVTDTLDTKLDWSTLEMMVSSHPYKLEIKNGNQATWIFEDIMLPDSTSNESESHGYIAYRLIARNTIAPGDTIRNTAFIYFDYNTPIATNTEKTFFAAESALPVTIINFNAHLRGSVVELIWKTSTEGNAKLFDIQRSNDGRHFVKIGSVKALNQPTGSDYVFFDTHPSTGNNYYRLVSADLDGRFTLSPIAYVRIRETNEVITQVIPNPANGPVQLKVDGNIRGIIKLTLYTALGQEIWMKNYGPIHARDWKVPLNTSGLRKGNYLLKTEINGKAYSNQLLVF